MAINLPPVPRNVPPTGPFGLLAPSWSDFLEKLFKRVGGHDAASIGEAGGIATEHIADAAVTADKIAAAVAGAGLSGGAGTALSVGVDNSTLEIASDALRIKSGGVDTNQLADEAVTFAKQEPTDWARSHLSSGYQRLPSGLKLNWGATGSLASGATGSATFVSAFSTACLLVLVSPKNNSATATTSTGSWGAGNYSTSGFDLYNRTSIALEFNWLAVGY